MTTAAIVLNSRAGAGRAQVTALARHLGATLAARGIDSQIIAFKPQRHGQRGWREQLDAAIADGTDQVWALGGDGTVLAIAEALLERPVALGIIPLGTANLLARDLAVPLEPAQAVELLVDAPVRQIDVGRVNGELFLCASMIGMTTALAVARENARGTGVLRLWSRMVRKTLFLLQRYPAREATLQLGGQQVDVHTRMLMVTNNPIAPRPGLYPPRPALDRGRLGIYGVAAGPFWELPRVAIRLLNGTWPDEPRIFHCDAPSLSVLDPPSRRRGGRITVINDGERLRLHAPLHYEVLPLALRVLAPAAGNTPGATSVDTPGDTPGR